MKSLRHLPFALLLALVSCSTEAAPVKTGGGAADSHGGAPKTEAPAPSGDTAEFAVEGNDLMQFSVTEIAVQAGQKVTITLKNVGKMPKTAMGHNLVVLKKGVTAADFGMRVNMVDYVCWGGASARTIRKAVAEMAPAIWSGTCATSKTSRGVFAARRNLPIQKSTTFKCSAR